MRVLLVLQERAVQRRDQLARIALPEHFRAGLQTDDEFLAAATQRGALLANNRDRRLRTSTSTVTVAVPGVG
jgi:hypothetical protein